VRFDEALSAAERVISEKLPGWAPRTVLVRDVFGKIRAAVDDRGQVERLPTEVIGATSQALDAVLGGYSPGVGDAILHASEMVAPDELFGDRDITANPQKRVRVLDRLVTGADWSRAPFPATQANRLTLYGVKGGVGRSTAAAVLCWRLAQANKRVLVFDLDLESPGVGTTLLPPEREPDF
jgi:Flp pilus assembly CpaE family ATPase